jgi:phosphohistidine phosphatase
MATLELYLIRHGVAEERGPKYPDDTRRPLTTRGMSELRQAAKGLEELGVSFDLIVTSPLVRTRQTAEIISATLADHPRVVTSDALTPEAATSAAVKEIARHEKKARVAVVGHEPNIGELAAHLIGAGTGIPFKKAAVCRIDFAETPAKGGGELRWFLPPRVLRKLG